MEIEIFCGNEFEKLKISGQLVDSAWEREKKFGTKNWGREVVVK